MTHPHFNHANRLILFFAAITLSLAVSSCGSSRHVASTAHHKSVAATPKKAPQRHNKVTRHIDVEHNADNSVTKNLLSEADSWLGTPYCWGGNDNNGVDCSGFVVQVYLRSLGISLPRTSEKQMEYCRLIDKNQLKPGDLVFFTVRGGSRVGHVGIYVGNGNMIHSSSSKGVVITPLDTPYFVSNYHSSGRVERYYAMMNDRKKPSAEPARTPKPQQPMLASGKKQDRNKNTATGKTRTNPTKTADGAKNAGTVTVPTPPEYEKNTHATPLPEQIFASKDRAAEADDEVENPDFFD